MRKDWKYWIGWVLGFIGEGLLFGLLFFIKCAIIEAVINLALKFIM